MSSREADQLPAHVLIFPLPAPGHLNPMINLAQLLCLSGLHVTFIVTEFDHRRLLKNTSTHSGLARDQGFQFQTIPDGLPDNHPRGGDKLVDVLGHAIISMESYFKKMMTENDLLASPNRRPVTCLIADEMYGFAADFAEESGIPLMSFRVTSACAFWASFCLKLVSEANEIPFQENGMDELVKSIPGMEGILRRRDLPSYRRLDDANNSILYHVIATSGQTVRAKAIIMNSFDDLEQPILSHILKVLPKHYTIGPDTEHVKLRLAKNKVDALVPSANLWAEDRKCIDWLNVQEPKSVIYASFGSIAVLTREQLLEFWYGLVNSRKKFLWVIRPDFIKGEGMGQIPAELEESTKENGCVVEWAPQEEVLNHPAVGGFLTHCGWNSVMESIVAGVPMICWPYFSDQMVVGRFMSEVWKIGLDMKDPCDRVVIEGAIKEIMEVRKDEFIERANQLAKLAKKAVSEGGSSYNNLNSLVEYIDSMII